MSINYPDAINAIYDTFLIGFNAPSKELLSYTPTIYWQNKERADKPPSDKFWCRVSTQTEGEEQTNVSVTDAAAYTRRYTAYGVVIIQLFCPKDVINSDKLGQQLSNIIKNCFRGKKTKCGVWFRNARINDNVKPEALYYRFNIISDFEYDEIA